MSAARRCTATFNTAAATTPDTIVDNGSPGTSQSGSWWTSTAGNPYGGNSIYARGGAYTRYAWRPAIPSAGRYEVWVWWTSSESRSRAVAYRVTHGTGASWQVRDQRTGGGRWQLLGTYHFKAGTEGGVQVFGSYSGTVSADAVRLIRK
jgi:hypothetical protein